MDNYTVEMDNYSLFLLSSDELPLVHQKQSIPIKKEEEEEEEEEEEKKKRGWKTTSGNAETWSSPSPKGQWGL